MSADEQFTLSELPSDIIRGIFRTELESINTLMLISPRWHSAVLAHLSARRCLPSVKSFSWRTEEDGNATMGLFVSPKYQNYFGLDGWESKEIPETLEDIDDGECVLFEKDVKNARIDCFLSRLVSRCSRVERMELAGFDVEKVNISQIITLMEDLTPEELFIPDISADIICGDIRICGRKLGYSISNLIRVNPIERLVLRHTGRDKSDIDAQDADCKEASVHTWASLLHYD